ncbi:type II toxin-antitoxin system RatA family toxin [Fulvivirga lutea]|uniref:SRPBCC family protein n=1 Tax=Fulvivirga lutea TaxID=2810512 RepID=A0A974WHK8_9BACT|nr:SRPBCC family protein [Fulvivirga lutea]QSE98683.1 SRPBCC family protein [Fulvivirga lutea]
MNTLQKFLAANALFSTAIGVELLLFQEEVEQLFGLPHSNFFFILGILLLVFALTLVVEIIKQRALPVLWIIVQDVLWVVASIIILIWDPYNITFEGNIAIAAVAAVVTVVAVGQSKGLARMDEGSQRGMKIFRFSRKVKGSKSKIWEVISDVGNYHKVAPNIDGAKIVSGEKEGLVRQCTHKGDSWTETCTLWQDERQYSFKVNTNAPDYPYPLKTLSGTWKIDENLNHEKEIIMVFEFEYKKPIHNVVLHPLMKYQFTKVCEELLDKWQEMIEKK